jgi:hypothetical protein
MVYVRKAYGLSRLKMAGEDFIESKAWEGRKEGYVFKKDGKGVGYYLDKPPQATYDPSKSRGGFCVIA